MPVLVFRNERSVGDLSDRLFTRLGSRQKERVEAALLAANPQLTNLADVPEGAVLHVPDIPELSHKRKPDPDTPGEVRKENVVGALEAFHQQFDQRIRKAAKQAGEEKELLRSAEFRKAWVAAGQDRELATPVIKALDDRAAALTERRKLVQEAVKELLAYLEK